MKWDSIEPASKESANHKLLGQPPLNKIVSEFRRRYQDAKTRDRLFPKNQQVKSEPTGKLGFETRIKKDFNSLTAEQKCQLLLGVIFRYRNNIFHGNKGVTGWLRYQEQIDMCTRAMLVWLFEKQLSSVSNLSKAQPVATQDTVIPDAGATGKEAAGSTESPKAQPSLAQSETQGFATTTSLGSSQSPEGVILDSTSPSLPTMRGIEGHPFRPLAPRMHL